MTMSVISWTSQLTGVFSPNIPQLFIFTLSHSNSVILILRRERREEKKTPPRHLVGSVLRSFLRMRSRLGMKDCNERADDEPRFPLQPFMDHEHRNRWDKTLFTVKFNWIFTVHFGGRMVMVGWGLCTRASIYPRGQWTVKDGWRYI